MGTAELATHQDDGRHPCLAYLEQVRDMAADSPMGAYHAWQRERARAVTPETYRLDRTLSALLTPWLRRRPPRYRDCYATALRTTALDPRIRYVEGHAQAVIPTAHAWNRWCDPVSGTDFHFDLTAETLFRAGYWHGYAAVVDLDGVTARRLWPKAKAAYGFTNYLYAQETRG